MSLQQNIIKSYRTVFPDDTLREIAQRTGIQLTRVFRLLNGSPMKLSEYESFHNLIDPAKQIADEMTPIKLLREHGHKLSSNEVSKIIQFIHRKVQYNDLVTGQQISSPHLQELA